MKVLECWSGLVLFSGDGSSRTTIICDQGGREEAGGRRRLK